MFYPPELRARAAELPNQGREPPSIGLTLIPRTSGNIVIAGQPARRESLSGGRAANVRASSAELWDTVG
jgi:hypothetical protein